MFGAPQMWCCDLAEIDEAANEKVEPAVVVVVEPYCARCPSRSGYSGLFGDVGEGAIAVVAIENAAAVLRDVEIGEAIGVVVADRDTHAVASTGHPGFFRHIGEGAVAVVVVEGIAERTGRREDVALPAVDQVDVHPSIVVVIEDRATGAG